MPDHPTRRGALVRMLTLRYRALNLPPFIVASMAAGNTWTSYFVLGICGVVVWALTQELMNRHADRAEDAIDYPDRGVLYELVGKRTFERLIVISMTTYVGIVVAMALVAHASWRVLVPWTLLMAGAVAYSYGPRLKATTWGGPILTAGTPPLLFHAAWRYSEDVSREFAVGLLLLVTVSLSMMYSKDADTLAGDGSIGYRSLYLWLKGEAGKRRARFLLLLPYLQVTALVSLGVVGPRFLGVWVVLPLTLAFARSMRRATTKQEQSVVREIGFYTKLVFVLTVLFVFEPTLATALIALASLSWYTAATRWFHAERGLHSKEHFELARALLSAQPDAQFAR